GRSVRNGPRTVPVWNWPGGGRRRGDEAVRTRSIWVAWSLLAAWTARVAVLVTLSAVNGTFRPDALTDSVPLLLVFATFLLVGALIVGHRPENASAGPSRPSPCWQSPGPWPRSTPPSPLPTGLSRPPGRRRPRRCWPGVGRRPRRRPGPAGRRRRRRRGPPRPGAGPGPGGPRRPALRRRRRPPAGAGRAAG